jgi:hypothetical protein
VIVVHLLGREHHLCVHEWEDQTDNMVVTTVPLINYLTKLEIESDGVVMRGRGQVHEPPQAELDHNERVIIADSRDNFLSQW